MKVFALFSAAAVALLASTSLAAECTEELTAMARNSPEIKKMNAVDCTAPPAKGSSCAANECLNALRAATKVLPDCTVDGAEMKADFSVQLRVLERKCEQATGTNTTTYKECTKEQSAALTNDADEAAAHAACGTDAFTGPFAPSDKGCDKACVDAWLKFANGQQKCTVGGSEWWHDLLDAAEVKKAICEERAAANGTSTATEKTTTPAGAAATAAPSAATTAPAKATTAPTTSGAATSMGVSAVATVVAAVVAATVQL